MSAVSTRIVPPFSGVMRSHKGEPSRSETKAYSTVPLAATESVGTGVLTVTLTLTLHVTLHLTLRLTLTLTLKL